MPHDLQRIHDLLDDLDDLSPSEMIDFNRKVEELRKAKMSDEKPKATTAADIHSAVNHGFGDVTRQLLALASEIAAVRGTQADHGAALAALRVSNSGMAPRPAALTSGGGACFPNYGRSKNQPVEGATMGDLEYYAAGCRRTLDDSNKSRWHEKERALLAAIEAEIARQSGGANPAQQPMPEAPPVPGFTSDGDDNLPF